MPKHDANERVGDGGAFGGGGDGGGGDNNC